MNKLTDFKSWRHPGALVKKVFLKARYTGIFIFAFSFQTGATTFAQKVTISGNHYELKDILKELRRQTGFYFIYSNEIIRNAKPVNVNLRNEDLDKALIQIFDQQQLSYSVKGKTLIVTEKIQRKVSPAVFAIDLKGKVTDKKGGPLPGATIRVKGDNKAVITNSDGEFQLKDISNDAVLIISYTGFVSQEVSVLGKKEIQISLVEDMARLDEVVVVGYGSLDRKELTSAVSTLRQKDLISGAVSPLLAIQGKVPGLNIESTNGTDPNAGLSLQLRGVNSVNASQGPLVVIDGVPGGDINSVVKEDIESINILRDASAAAIYGTRASGGVILITTKKPQAGETNVTFTSELFTETVRRRPEMLSGDEFVANGLGDDLGHRTDWYKEVTNKNPISQRYVLSMSGGTENANLYATVFKRNAKGIAIGSKREEIGGRINSNFKFFNGIAELATNISYTQVDADFTNNDIFNMALVLNPTETPYNSNDITGYNVLVGGYDYWNPVAEVALRSDHKQYKYLLANSTLKVNLTKDLFATATVGIKSNNQHDTFYRSAQHRESRLNGIDGYGKQEFQRWDDRIFESTMNYNKKFDNHSINAVAGYSYQDFNGQGFNANNSNFPVDGIRENDLGTGTFLVDGRAGMGSYKNPWIKLAAFFGRVNYSFKDRYIVTATMRREGSSKFAPGNKWGTFPGLSLGWRLSEESFIKKLNVFDDLKIRAGYGETGNEGFNANVATRMYSADTWYLANGTWIRTYGVMHNQNKNIRWEVKKEYNIGMDFSLFNRKLSGRFDYYKRVIDDLIYDISVSQPPAIHDKTTINIGSMQNEGFEFELNYNAVKTTDWNYTTTLVAAHNKSRLNSLWGNQTFADRKGFPAPGSPGNAVRLYPGQDLGQFFIWQFAGFTPEGQWMLNDRNNEAFDVSKRNKTIADKRFIGNGIPKLQLSWNHSISYKNWDAGVYMRSWLNYDVFNMINMYYSLPNVKGQNVLKEAYTAHKDIKGEKELSDYWLEKGDFLKIDAVSLGYTFSKSVIKPLKNLRLYATGRDLFVFTNYSGLDPQVNINGLDPGFEERNAYPKTRTFMFGLQANF
ncbi:SusC/RagA family TonB-linked outer membrane protein [Pedobacter antarcticus]|uniref:SusC/RagA family TonB-linked outer membrane protein n=1 Tax=Pedobacter antarcticus TaxID=34086 RepID=UPI00088A4B92|nr:SusC/RagA family TonB-linked outer membrane protein [Pedobacter antarcticus]SDM28574.1 TonB-linked outer membrane protein, SusC/RagA family [Pedobacter antarcticus]